MAQLSLRRQENAAGNFYVDTTCIDCGMCYWAAPTTFEEVGDQSAVVRQPQSEAEIFAAAQALVSCPTASIGTEKKPPEVDAAIRSYPFPVNGPVFHCGFHSKLSFGATSYLLLRPGGNVLIDSPRFVTALVHKIEEMGGIRYLFLTHQDDVADHAQFQKHFGCERILHRNDYRSSFGGIERLIDGEGATTLEPGLELIPVPGHTRGHVCLLADGRYLFTGDHLAWNEASQALRAFPDACWYSWAEQTRSMKKLLGYSFEWVLPGHGRRHHAPAKAMQEALEKCVAWMETYPA